MIYLLQYGDFLRKEKMSITITDNLMWYPCSFENLKTFTFFSGEVCIPIGTVEFVKEYCAIRNITLPNNISYPIELVGYLGRSIWSSDYASVKSNLFVKPKHTKVFTGAIKRDITEIVPDNEPVWVADPVVFTSEYRYYVIDKEIAGYSRYDDGDDAVNEDQMSNVVKQMIDKYISAPIGYSIDIGIVDGNPVLIEVNDGWSLGLYLWGTMTNVKYVELVTKRWIEIVKDTI